MRNAEHIKAEHERARILECMADKKLSNQDIREALGITKGKLSHHLKVLVVGKYITIEHRGGNNYFYKRTGLAYTVKPAKVVKVEAPKKEIPKAIDEDMMDLQPTLPHARVIRLLKNPLPPAPKRKRNSMYGSMQSGLTMFSMESGL